MCCPVVTFLSRSTSVFGVCFLLYLLGLLAVYGLVYLHAIKYKQEHKNNFVQVLSVCAYVTACKCRVVKSIRSVSECVSRYCLYAVRLWSCVCFV